MMNSIFSDGISCLNLKRLISSEVWPRSDAKNVLNADFGNSNGATFFGQDQDAILIM